MARRTNIPKGMPDYKDLINPTIQALQKLGGSGNIDEIYVEVINRLNLDEEIIDFPHSKNGGQSEVQYRLAWARTYLKIYGIITNSKRGVWIILPSHKDIQEVDVDDCVSTVKKLFSHKNNNTDTDNDIENDGIDLPPEAKSWREKLHKILIEMNPYGFERLTQRLLREIGFSSVEVTKKSGDGGIDGYGVFKINGILSFKVAFQCKRYNGIVPVSDIRDFRGSLTTDFEKAVFITTGSFSKPALEEAIMQGKKQIDLMDGEDLIDKLAEYNIGVSEVVDYEIDESFFEQFGLD